VQRGSWLSGRLVPSSRYLCNTAHLISSHDPPCSVTLGIKANPQYLILHVW